MVPAMKVGKVVFYQQKRVDEVVYYRQKLVDEVALSNGMYFYGKKN